MVQRLFQEAFRISGTHVFGAFVWLLAVAWLWRVLPALLYLPRIPDLHDEKYSAALSPVDTPSMTVIVPARNEAPAMEATLRALLACEYSALHVIAVDDRSTDATGKIMDAVAGLPEAVGKLTVLHVAELPAGWLGKPHALALAAQSAQTEWLLFTDGDVLFAPDIFRRAMNYAQESRADHLVVYPTMILKGWAEHGFLTFFQSLSVWAGRPWRIADARAKRDFIGVGAFNLIRRSVYEQLGGFEALGMEVLEDMRIGYKVKHAGYAQRVAFGRDMVRIRWAEGVLGMVNNLTKNMYSAFRFRTSLLLAACVGILLLCLTPVVALAIPSPARYAGVVTMVALLLLNLRYWKQTRLSPLNLIYFPIGALLLLYTMLRSLVLTYWRGGVLWRGTLYPLAELRRYAREKS